jgi:hypothetical protein
MLIYYLLLNILNAIKSTSSQYLTTPLPLFFHWEVYYSSGVIYHIDSNLTETFEAWYDQSQNASRIDYNNGKLSDEFV